MANSNMVLNTCDNLRCRSKRVYIAAFPSIEKNVKKCGWFKYKNEKEINTKTEFERMFCKFLRYL